MIFLKILFGGMWHMWIMEIFFLDQCWDVCMSQSSHPGPAGPRLEESVFQVYRYFYLTKCFNPGYGQTRPPSGPLATPQVDPAPLATTGDTHLPRCRPPPVVLWSPLARYPHPWDPWLVTEHCLAGATTGWRGQGGLGDCRDIRCTTRIWPTMR